MVRTLSILKALCFKEDEGKCQFFSLAPWHRGKCVHSMGGGRLGDGGGGSGGVGGCGRVALVRSQGCGHTLPLAMGAHSLDACPPKGAS